MSPNTGLNGLKIPKIIFLFQLYRNLLEGHARTSIKAVNDGEKKIDAHGQDQFRHFSQIIVHFPADSVGAMGKVGSQIISQLLIPVYEKPSIWLFELLNSQEIRLIDSNSRVLKKRIHSII
ncbi:unnamed protein product [Strongylus vulgaris]|uniref:Uncharacterized protein n=1 Tax=Strongylus vulgaris TaxID=40348 RepID=A0A3P7J8I6_STRVU|nr:unnamed protein product [Strongylus vulgaris]